MSWKISGLVWELNLTHSQQSVLLAMADHAEHDGSKVFPSVARIAWKTGYSERQVRRVMSDLREMKILIIVRESNRYRPREYKIDISAGKKKHPFRDDIVSPLAVEDDSTPTSRGDMGVAPEPSDLTPVSTRADIATSTRADIAMSDESSLNIIKPSERLDSRNQDSWVQALVAIQDTHYRQSNLGFRRYWQSTEYGGRQDGKFIVICEDEDQRAWLADRGKKIAEHALVGVLGESVEVEFVIAGAG